MDLQSPDIREVFRILIIWDPCGLRHTNSLPAVSDMPAATEDAVAKSYINNFYP